MKRRMEVGRPGGGGWGLLLGLLLCLPLAQAEGLVLGINTMWGPGKEAVLRTRFQKARSLGVTQVRLDWEWREAQPRRGDYRWDAFDTLVRVAHEEGVQLLPIVHYAPDWALRQERKAADIYELAPQEGAFDEYADFLRASIQRYGPQGDAPQPFTPIVAWQVWNEPNIKQFWGPAPDAAAFVKLMRAVQRQTQDLRGRIKLVHAGLSKSDLIYFWQLWEQDSRYGETFDIMAVHPYLFHWWQGIRAPNDMDKDEPRYAALGVVGSHDDPGYLGKVFNLQLLMTLKGFPGKPIWITEMGYFVAERRLGVSDRELQDRLGETLAFIQARLTDKPYGQGVRGELSANVQRVYWFALEDYPSPDGMGSFGLYRADGSPRPAVESFRGQARRLNGP
ncbi:MAG: hypothetical protein ABWY06_05310 [Pseudomonas sp.]|uniref:hypothetical protein n=1 Tax=Pseudomonas sp. TaxID=306 RepID=UPI00339B9491